MEPRETARKFVALLAAGDAHGWCQMFAPQGRCWDSAHPGPAEGPAQLLERFEVLRGALSNALVSPVDVLSEGHSAAIRWLVQARAPSEHVMEALTWINLGKDGIEDARTFMDGAAWLWPADEKNPPHAATVAHGAPMALVARDHRGLVFDLTHQRGRVVCILCASRRVQMRAHHVAQQLGAALGGQERATLVLVLDGTDIPAALRPVARAAAAALRTQVMRHFHQGFVQANRPTPHHMDDLAWLLPDFEGNTFAGLGVVLPLAEPVLLVVDALGNNAGQWSVGSDEAVAAAVTCARQLVESR